MIFVNKKIVTKEFYYNKIYYRYWNNDNHCGIMYLPPRLTTKFIEEHGEYFFPEKRTEYMGLEFQDLTTRCMICQEFYRISHTRIYVLWQ